jgi:two-component system cell cycle response regulator
VKSDLVTAPKNPSRPPYTHASGGTLLTGPESLRPTEAARGLLTVVSGSEAGRVFSLAEKGKTTLGRVAERDVRIASEAVSALHADILCLNDVYVFTDLRSTNGSFVNDVRVENAVRLRDGDRIRLGPRVELKFLLLKPSEELALKRLYEDALLDGLTRIFNRKHIEERLDAEVSFALRHNANLSLLILDIDFFKRINDEHGHPGGDAVLMRVSALLASSLRNEDVVGRYGGEEFVVLARGIDVEGGGLLAERLRLGIEQLRIAFGNAEVPVTASFGVASLRCCGDQKRKETLLHIADKRLYEAKRSGRNRVVAA